MSGVRSVVKSTIRALARIELVEALAVGAAGIVAAFQRQPKPASAESAIEVDAVYLWVNDNDSAWQASRQAALGRSATDGYSIGHSANSDSRFREFGELEASIRLLAKNAPFIRRVHIVTAGQTPKWRKPIGSLPFELRIVDHTNFMPAEYLPTFNSHALTANLHRIADIAEHFLYLNDDVLVGKPSSAETWFKDHMLRLRYTATPVPERGNLSADDTVYLPRHNVLALASKERWPIIEGMPEHGPHPIFRDVMVELWQHYQVALERTSQAKFRSATDLNPEWLVNQYLHAQGRAIVEKSQSYKYVAMNKPDSVTAIIDLLLRRGRVQSICLNDESQVGAERMLKGGRLARRYRRVLRRIK
jgi:hypothetical protein